MVLVVASWVVLMVYQSEQQLDIESVEQMATKMATKMALEMAILKVLELVSPRVVMKEP